jgi:hypothetical protein
MPPDRASRKLPICGMGVPAMETGYQTEESLPELFRELRPTPTRPAAFPMACAGRSGRNCRPALAWCGSQECSSPPPEPQIILGPFLQKYATKRAKKIEMLIQINAPSAGSR